VGKTSLARTAAIIHSSSAFDPPTIECEPKISTPQLLRDIILRCVPPEVKSQSTTRVSAKAGLPFLSAEIQREIRQGEIPNIDSINSALSVLRYVAGLNKHPPIIVIDEFDVIEDEETRRAFASFLKHVSDQETPIRFIVCGIGRSLDEMIGSHLSTGRYLMPIELERLPHDARWEIVTSAADELGVCIDRNTYVRIGQISDGFPYYVHLIGEKLFWAMKDSSEEVKICTPEHFAIALREASVEAEPSLKRSYELATQKYNDDYQPVLWAVADNALLRRQMKDIFASYQRIIMEYRRINRTEVSETSNQASDLRRFYNRMNALRTARHGCILRTASAGWYEFTENRLRGYVRLVAERAGIELEPEHFLGGNSSSRAKVAAMCSIELKSLTRPADAYSIGARVGLSMRVSPAPDFAL
jgi:hypothetical protein